MSLKKKNWQLVAKVLLILSLVAVFFSAWGFLFSDLWLASTQWLLIAITLASFGLYAKMEK